MTHCDPYPSYSRPERIADGAVHIAAIVLAAMGTAFLLIWAAGQSSLATLTGLWVYGAALTGSFIASFCYHFTPWETARPLLRRIDHAAIYLKIAGTYTPLVILIGSAFAYGILAVVWGLAALGVAMKLFFWGRPTRWGVGLYLGLGWLSVTLATSLMPVVSGTVMALIIAGGLVYSIGAILFSLDGLKYQNAIWHSFVLIASICFFAAIALGVLPQG